MDIKSECAKLVESTTGIANIADLLEFPSDPSMGDVALPCFKLSKELRKSPVVIASELAQTIGKSPMFSRIEPVNGYLNFFVAQQSFVESVLLRETACAPLASNGKTVCIDFSSVNIAKPFHVGHLLTTVIGNALYKIYAHLGYTSVGINHLGDFGTQFGKLIAAYKLWGNKEDVEQNKVQALLSLYVRFHEEAEKDESLNDLARSWFKRIEENDPEAAQINEWFKEITLSEVKEVYKRLNVHFDYYMGESYFSDKMTPIIDELRDKNLLTLSDGAQVVDLSEYGLPPCLIVKSDGATLYATRDLAAAYYRKNTFNFHKCLYVVAYQQNLHFQQFFKVLELMGNDWAKECVHVAFGMVSLESGTLSTRKGNVVLLNDVLDAAVDKTLHIINEKNPDLSEKESVAQVVGVGAVIFSALYSSRIKDMVFNWDNVLNFDGETAPYVQYTYARCCSLMRKAGEMAQSTPDFSDMATPLSFSLCKLLNDFYNVLYSAAEKYEPYLLSRYLVDVAQAFNKYYFETRIVDGDNPGQSAARLTLVLKVMDVLKTGLSLLGIGAPERM